VTAVTESKGTPEVVAKVMKDAAVQDTIE